jgi:hypothetical protein
VKLKISQNIKVEFPQAKQEKALDVDFDVEILHT